MSRKPRTPAPTTPSNYPEFVVRRNVICGFFSPTLPHSTFHDLVNDGRIVPFKHVRGFYLLNDSLRRLGLREVATPPADAERPSVDDLTRLAFHVMEPEFFPAPSWLLSDDADFVLDSADAEHLSFLILHHQPYLADLDSPALKLSYLQGVIDAAYILAKEQAKGGEKNPKK